MSENVVRTSEQRVGLCSCGMSDAECAEDRSHGYGCCCGSCQHVTMCSCASKAGCIEAFLRDGTVCRRPGVVA